MLAGQLLFVLYSSLASGMAIFLVAAGLTWVFGIQKILNMAHGSFFTIGAYVAAAVYTLSSGSLAFYALGILAASVVIGVLGFFTDKLVFRRLVAVDYHYTLIGTFALHILIQGLIKITMGPEVTSISVPRVFRGALQIGDFMIPKFVLFVIISGLLVYAIIELVLQRTRSGKVMQALTLDPWMCGMLGLNVPRLLTASVVVSFVLVGLAGGLLLPGGILGPGMGDRYFLLAFLAVIIGGMGSIRGAFFASILLSLVSGLNDVLLPSYPGIAIYVALAIFLVMRPHGLFPPLGATR